MRVLVLGGGVTGLSAAHYLRHLLPNCSICLLEASGRLGGWLESTCHSDGVVFEHGPRTVRPQGVAGDNTLQLVQELGLENSVCHVSRSHPAATNRMVSVDGQLHSLPNSFASLFRTLAPFRRPLALSLYTDLVSAAPPQPRPDDDNVYAFAARRFGADVARYAVDPLIRGVCAGDARRVSARFLFNTLYEYEHEAGGVLRGWCRQRWRQLRGVKPEETVKASAGRPADCRLVARAAAERWSVWYLPAGLQTLTDRLSKTLQSQSAPSSAAAAAATTTTQLLTDSPVQQLQLTPAGGATVTTGDGTHHHCDHVISALPAPALAGVIVGASEFSRLLAQVTSVDVAVINLQYSGGGGGGGGQQQQEEEMLVTPPGFGYLVPSCQAAAAGGVLGVTFDSCVRQCNPATATATAGAGDTVLTVMAGGANSPQHLRPDTAGPEQLLAVARAELGRSLGAAFGRRPPTRWHARWLRSCIPQYVVGHRALVARLRSGVQQRHWPLTLAGCSYDGVSVNDCILSGRRAAEAVARRLSASC